MSTKITFVGLEGDVESALIDASSEDEGPSGTDGVVINISSLVAEWDSAVEKWDLRLTVEIIASDDSLWTHWHYTVNSTFSASPAGGYHVRGSLIKTITGVSPGTYSFAVVAANDDHEAVSNIDITTIVLPSDGSAYSSTSVLDGEETISVNLSALAEELETTTDDLVSAIIASTSVDTEVTDGTPLIGGKTYYKNAETIVTAEVANSWFGGERNQPSSLGLPSTDPKVIGIVHDGNLNLDGHAEKIMLTRSANIRGKLPHVNLSAQGDVDGPAVFKSNVKTWPESEYIGKAIPEIDSTTGEYYLDLSLLREDMEGMGDGAFEEYPDFSTTLFEDITDSQEEITLTDGVKFPPSGGYVKIGSEYILYSGKTGDDVLTGCTRGLGSSTSSASEHSAGETVSTISKLIRAKHRRNADALPSGAVDERKDFVFGSNSTETNFGTALQNHKFLFDKHVGAFRAGGITSPQWNSANRGYYSTVFGFNGVAIGDATFTGGAFGYTETIGSFNFGVFNRIWEGAGESYGDGESQQGSDGESQQGSDGTGEPSSESLSAYFSYSNTITGGEYNDIYNGYSSGILSGAISWMDFSRSSAIASGEKNWIRGSCDEKVRFSFIGAGFENTINFSDGAAIVSGDSNIIGGDSHGSFIGSGENNHILTNEDASESNDLYDLFENRDKLIIGDPKDMGVEADRWSCEDDDGYARAARRSTKRSSATDFLGTSYNSFIGSGDGNTIVNSNLSFVAGGKYNLIALSEGSSILGGRTNSIEPYIYATDDRQQQWEDGISVGESDYVAIVGGRDNWIMADANASTIVGGVGNSISESEVGMLFGKDNIARKTPHTSVVTRFTKTTGYAAKSNLYGQHSHASGGFYSLPGKRAKGSKGYTGTEFEQIRKTMGYGEGRAQTFLRTRDSESDALLQRVRVENSKDESGDKELSLATGKNRADAATSGQSKFAINISEEQASPEYDSIWSSNAFMHIGSAQTSVLTLRREVTQADLNNQYSEQVTIQRTSLATGAADRESFVTLEVPTFTSSSSGPKYLIFTRVLSREEKASGAEQRRASHGGKSYMSWYHSTGGEGDSDFLKNSNGDFIPHGEDYSTPTLASGTPQPYSYPRQYAKNNWLQMSDTHLQEAYGIPAVGFTSFAWPWHDRLLQYSEEKFPGTGGVRSYGGLDFGPLFRTIPDPDPASGEGVLDPFGSPITYLKRDPIKEITNAWDGAFHPADTSVRVEGAEDTDWSVRVDGTRPEGVEPLMQAHRMIYLQDDIILHPMGVGSEIRVSSTGELITITEEMFDEASEGGDGYWYLQNSDGSYTFYYRCIDMEYDLGKPYPTTERIAEMSRIEFQNAEARQSTERGLADTFEKLDILQTYRIEKLYIPIIQNPTENGGNPAPNLSSSEFELYLSDPEFSQVLEIEPYSVWGFSVTAVVTTHSTSYANAKIYSMLGAKKGSFRTAVMKACGGIAYPGLHGGDSDSLAELSSAIVFSNDDNGFDKNSYSDGAPLDGANLPITVSKVSGHYMDNYMRDDDDPGFYLKVDAGSTTVPFGAFSILPPHKDYLRLIIGTNVPCRVVARVELTQLSGAESYVESTELVRVSNQISEDAADKTPTIVLQNAIAEIEDSTVLELRDFEATAVLEDVKGKGFEQLTTDELNRVVVITDAIKGVTKTAQIEYKESTTTSVLESVEGSSLIGISQEQLETALIERAVLTDNSTLKVEEVNQSSAAAIDQAALNLQNQLDSQNSDGLSNQQQFNQYIDSKNNNQY